jgi:hypothetical protein
MSRPSKSSRRGRSLSGRQRLIEAEAALRPAFPKWPRLPRGSFLTSEGYPTLISFNVFDGTSLGVQLHGTLQAIDEVRPPHSLHPEATRRALAGPGVHYAPWKTRGGGWELLALDPYSRLIARMSVDPARSDKESLFRLALARRDLEAVLDAVNESPLQPLPVDSCASPFYGRAVHDDDDDDCDDAGEEWKS